MTRRLRWELNQKDEIATRNITSNWCNRGSDGKFHHELCREVRCECECHGVKA